MNNKFLSLIVLFILFFVFYRYYQYAVVKNFVLEVNTICNSKLESCFDASEDLSFGQNPYKKVSIIAHYAPKCLENHDCESFSCSEDLKNISQCKITYCSDDTKVDGESCLADNK